jgi:hypothetical protein
MSSAIFLSFLASKLMFANTSTMSAVPAAELMAREEVLGMRSPAAATIGTTRRVTLFPGTPPTEWKSKTGPRSNWIVSPVVTMALVRSTVSRMFMPLM